MRSTTPARSFSETIIKSKSFGLLILIHKLGNSTKVAWCAVMQEKGVDIVFIILNVRITSVQLSHAYHNTLMQSNFTCYTAKIIFLLSILSRFPVKISEYSCIFWKKKLCLKKRISDRGVRKINLILETCSFCFKVVALLVY